MANDPQTTPLIHTSIFIPWCAGGSRDERLARKYCYAASIMPRNPINSPDRHSGPHFVIPAKAGIQGWGWGNVARSKTTRGEGLVPRQ